MDQEHPPFYRVEGATTSGTLGWDSKAFVGRPEQGPAETPRLEQTE